MIEVLVIAASAATYGLLKKRQERKAWEDDAVGRQADAILERWEARAREEARRREHGR